MDACGAQTGLAVLHTAPLTVYLTGRSLVCMPTYVYRREDGTKFEIKQSITADPLETCPETGQPVERIISGSAGLIFKGSGFYETDYKRSNGSSGASSPSNGNSSNGNSSDSSSSSARASSDGSTTGNGSDSGGSSTSGKASSEDAN